MSTYRPHFFTIMAAIETAPKSTEGSDDDDRSEFSEDLEHYSDEVFSPDEHYSDETSSDEDSDYEICA